MNSALPRRKIGPLDVSAIGLGCMGMSYAYGTPDEASGMETLARAHELGMSFLDTAEAYGPYTNEQLVGRAIKSYRDEVQLATKFGFKFVDGKRVEGPSGNDGTPANARKTIDESLKRLGVDTIDLWYLHRIDPDVPVEETVGAMAEAVAAGKVRYLGLSECSAATIRRAHKVHPIAALQSEYSLWTRDVEAEVLPTLRELGIGFVPFSPLGRGFLTGTVDAAALKPGDFRLSVPRFNAENATSNESIVDTVRGVAAKYDMTPAQIALAWVLRAGDDVVPIPGTTRAKRIDENAGALRVQFDTEDLIALDGIAARTAGERYNAAVMATVNK
jgi:aryl-alcohol dehydrogenase-like predicted oxidoreductase